MSSLEKAMERLRQKQAESKQAEYQDFFPKADVPEADRNVQDKPAQLNIDIEYLVDNGFLPQNFELSRQYAEFRRIKRPIISQAFKNTGSSANYSNMAMVTSSLPGEGKTFSVINLAMNMVQEKDITVMIIDADFMRRSLSKALKVDRLIGLMEVLEGKASLEQVIVNTNYPQLKIIPAGQPHKHTSELLASDRMKQYADDLANRYHDRIVLIDAPPLLVASDAEIISHYAGQAVVVVEAEETAKVVLENAIEKLDESVHVGMILNKSKSPSKLFDYAGGYYGDYYDDYDTENK